MTHATLTLFLASVLTLLTQPANAQEKRPRREQDPLLDEEKIPEPRGLRTKVVSLKYANAETIAGLLQKLYPNKPPVAVADSRTNSLLIQGSRQTLDEVEALIRQMDVEPDTAQRERMETKVYKLLNRRPDPGLEKVLSLVLSGNGRIAMDPQGGLVIVQAGARDLQTVESVLKTLDQPPDQGAPRTAKRLRVAWLVRGAGGGKELRPPPEDLKGVVEELGKAGVNELRLVAQAFVSALPGENFKLTSSTSDLDRPWAIEIQGSIIERAEALPEINLSISASQLQVNPPGAPPAPMPGRPNTFSISTTVQAPLARPIVLCVTPTGEMTSVFVIELRS